MEVFDPYKVASNDDPNLSSVHAITPSVLVPGLVHLITMCVVDFRIKHVGCVIDGRVHSNIADVISLTGTPLQV